MPKMINLTIDGMETQVEAGSTILQAANAWAYTFLPCAI